MAKILSGTIIRDEIKKELRAIVSTLPESEIPDLAIVQVGDLDASNTYIKGKIKFGEEIGVKVILHKLDETISENEVIKILDKLNQDKKVGGIIVQLPLPGHIDKNKIIDSIDPLKDIDGLHSVNVKKLITEDKSGIIPATSRGIVTLLKYYDISLAGKKVAVIGRSALVGKPTALALLNCDATVTIAHHLSNDLSDLCKNVDIIISATGVPSLITKDFVKKGQIIIDVGITKLNGKIVGDVSSEEVGNIVDALTPVPGGIGPMTIASLFQNLLRDYTKDIN